MARKIGRPTEATDEYIRRHAGSMSQREIAAKTGLSASCVNKRIKAMGGVAALKSGRVSPDPAAGPDVNTLQRLEQLRDMLLREMCASGGASLARLAGEYRKTLESIDAIEGVSRRDESGTGKLGELLARFADRA